MLEIGIALAVVKPLARVVFSGIVGRGAYDLAKKLWDLPREDVDELEVALLSSAFGAVVDCYERAQEELKSTLTKDELKRINQAAKEFRQAAGGVRKAGTELVAKTVALCGALPAPADDQPGASFGPLVAYACREMPAAVAIVFSTHFESRLRIHFRRQLRDNERVFRLFTTDLQVHEAACADAWRKLDEERDARRIEQLASVAASVVLVLDETRALHEKVDALTAEMRVVLTGILRYLETHETERRAITDRLPEILLLATSAGADQPTLADARDLLRGYPEPQPKWVGRTTELAELHTAWMAPGTRVYAVIGFGGEGKTALVRRFTEALRRQTDEARRPVVVWWSFYFHHNADEFFAAMLTHFGIPLEEHGAPLSAELRARKLCDLLRTGVAGRPLLLVLDGLETMQDQTPGREGRLDDAGLRELLTATLNDERPVTGASGTIVVTTREPLRDLRREDDARYGALTLEELSPDDGVALLTQRYRLKIDDADARAFVQDVGGHALTLTLIGGLLQDSGRVAIELADLRDAIAGAEAKITDPNLTTRKEKFHRLPGYVLRHCADKLADDQCQFLRLLSCCVRAATGQDIEAVFLHALTTPGDPKPFNDRLAGRAYGKVSTAVIGRLRHLHLVDGNEASGYAMHPLVRRHFYEEEDPATGLTNAHRRAVHSRFFDALSARPVERYPDTFEELQPLLDAVWHGCRGDRADEAWDLFYNRVGRMGTRGIAFYLIHTLGALGAHLEALRSFYPDASFDAEPTVTTKERTFQVIAETAEALLDNGNLPDAVARFERCKSFDMGRGDWAAAGVICRNLADSYIMLGCLPKAAVAAQEALDCLGRTPPDHEHRDAYAEFSHGLAATVAALRNLHRDARKYFEGELRLRGTDHLVSLDGAWYCIWLARCGRFEDARTAAAGLRGESSGRYESMFASTAQAFIERLARAAQDRRAALWNVIAGCTTAALQVGRDSGQHFYFTYAILEAGRCAGARAEHDAPKRAQYVAEAEQYLREAEQRADYAGYRLILADLHVARAHLAWLAADPAKMHEHCRQAIAICDEPDCGYAWARQEAAALLARPVPPAAP